VAVFVDAVVFVVQLAAASFVAVPDALFVEGAALIVAAEAFPFSVY
jgi:hypothetical protein